MRIDTSRVLLGDVLEAMENRHDFTKMTFTLELFRHVLFKLVPDVIMHTQNQDEEQIRDNYDRTFSSIQSAPSKFVLVLLFVRRSSSC